MRPVVKVTALAIFAIVDVVLLVLVLRGGDAVEPGEVTRPTSEPSASASAGAQAEPAGPVKFMLGGGNVLMRITQGSCTGTGRPVLEISTDRGARFREVALPTLDDSGRVVSVVLGAESTSADELTLVAGDEKCQTHGYTTTDGGETWTAGDVPPVWYVGADGQSVVSPALESQPGCTVASLSPQSEINVKVLCTSGVVKGTNDSGLTWVELGTLSEAVSATFVGLRQGYGVAPQAECRSQLYSTADAGGSWTPVACIDEKATMVALVGRGSRLTATDGETAWFSDDSGLTWEVSAAAPDDD